MKRSARPSRSAECPRYPTLAQTRTTRAAFAAGLGALLLTPLAGCLEAVDVGSPSGLDGGPQRVVDSGGVPVLPSDVGVDAGPKDDAGPDAGPSSAGDAIPEDGGI